MHGVAGGRASVAALALGLVCGLAPAIRAGQSVPRFPSFPLPSDPPPAANPVRGGWDPARLEQWLDAVERHVPGEVDGSLASAAGWAGADLRQLWVDVQVLLQLVPAPTRSRFAIQSMASEARPASGERPAGPRFRKDERAALEKLAERVRARGINQVVRRAAVLHTDVVTLGAGIAAPTGVINVGAALHMHIGDGTALGVQGVNVHWDLARMVLSHVTPDPTHDHFVRDWYRATVATAQAVEFFDALHLSLGLKLFPDDPELLLLAGAEREALASPLFQAFARTFRSPTMRTGIASIDRELSAAERFYRRALEAKPDMGEARVRLGRVLVLQGQYGEAARELRQAAEGSPRSVLGYYAALFLGTALEGMGDLEAARDSLRTATAISPESRAPHLALARIARELGDREDTTASLDRALERFDPDESADPFWIYRGAPGRRRAAWLDEIRAAARADRP